MDALLNQLTLLIQDLRIPEEADCMRQLQIIRERLHQPQLRLAVIGNFSCGKSTFLNAILKKPLLSMANMPTTAIPTYIDWRAPGNTLQVTLKDALDQPHPLDDGGKEWFQRQTGTALPADDGGMLDLLTTTNSLHGVLSGVHISFPRNTGYPGYCLIDTPGINPGEETAAEHILHTQDILRDEADTAIVLFPSYCAYTRDFSDFLEQNARHLLANSIFIVTKIDIVPTEREREKLAQFVKANLQTKLGLEDPQVYCCSAGCALDHYTGTVPGMEQWAQDFEAMIGEIFASLEPRRLQLVSGHTVAMIMELIRTLRTEMDEKQAELQRLLRKLEKYSYEELQNRYMYKYTAYADKAQAAKTSTYRQTKSRIESVVDGAVSNLCSGVNSCSGKWELNSYVKSEAQTVTDQTTQRLQNILEQAYTAMRDEQKSIYREFSNDVEQLLDEFDFLMGSVQQVANRLERKQPVKQMSVDLDIQLTSAQDEIWSSLSLFTGGIVAPSGSLIVLLAKIILSSFVSLPDAKKRVTEEIKIKLFTAKNNARIKCNEVGDQLLASHKNAAKKLMLEYQKTHKELFEQKRKELERRRRELEDALALNSRRIASLETIARQVQAWAAAMANGAS